MLLDFLATNDWTRPLYFANPGSVDHIFNINEYCHLEGFVYKFMPVKAENYIRGLGGLSIDESYDIMMNKCAWGNLADPAVTIDRESYRNSVIPKQNLMRLAQGLANERKFDSAVAVVEKVKEIFPNEKISFDRYMIPFVEVYYQAGEVVKGNELMELIIANLEEDLDYYNSQSSGIKTYFAEDKQTTISILYAMKQISDEYFQEEMSAKIDTILEYQFQFLDMFEN